MCILLVYIIQLYYYARCKQRKNTRLFQPFILTPKKNSSRFIVLLSQYFSTFSLSYLSRLSYCGISCFVSIDISPFRDLSAIVSQLFPHRDQL
jgi:hypothetical protein